MASGTCAICGADVGLLTSLYRTADNRSLCGECANKKWGDFPFSEYTLEEYYIFLNQMEQGRNLYESLFKNRINLKQFNASNPLKGLFKKSNDEGVRRYGVNGLGLWAVEDFGMVLIRDLGSLAGFIPKETDIFYFAYRYSEIVSYKYVRERVGETDSDDGTVVEGIKITFSGAHIPRVRLVSTGVKAEYNKFDEYFKNIVGSNMSEWDRRADEALRSVGR